ncbi:hypothetical protein ACHAWO_003203 [Cyclotella atomus]|uniref:Secreted protein n=1 Tax=Cyclotella atomus TaxID=382360 RepID=A0ABD3R9T9_9STRA
MLQNNCIILCVHLFTDCIVSWFIYYWMEGGRDNAIFICLALTSQSSLEGSFTHKITTSEHWNKQVVLQNLNDRSELDYDTIHIAQTMTSVANRLQNCSR